LKRLSAYQILIIKRVTCTIVIHLNTQIEYCIVDGLKDTN